mmetsp:Transcript_10839/g.24562  ORF Transcript_10839/g.24562 Transcript_10839/m.24562 type:complete len:116 (+) Transcript_10839:381-728(+)
MLGDAGIAELEALAVEVECDVLVFDNALVNVDVDELAVLDNDVLELINVDVVEDVDDELHLPAWMLISAGTVSPVDLKLMLCQRAPAADESAAARFSAAGRRAAPATEIIKRGTT